MSDQLELDLTQEPNYDLQRALECAAKMESRRVDFTVRATGRWAPQPFTLVIVYADEWQDAPVKYGLLTPPEPTGNEYEYVVYRHRNGPPPP